MGVTCTTQLASNGCTILIERRTPTVVLLRISGHDVGEFGALPMRCIDVLMPTELPVELYVDAREARGASIDVSNDWAAWLGRRRERFAAIHMATGSRFVAFTAEFVRRFSELEGIMTVHADAAGFDAALAQSAPHA